MPVKREWLDPPDIEPPVGLAKELGVSGWIAGVLARRGLVDLKAARGFLDPNAYTPALPGELPGLEAVVTRLEVALQRCEQILVWGDFDVDGQTATALLVEGLRELGGVVRYHIPIRAQESHGVGLPVLRQFLEDANPPKLVLTCDTGIAAFDAVEYASVRGVDFLITDHHELPRQPESQTWHVPNTNWIVTPRFLPDNHPLATLPGVGVAYKLIEALYMESGLSASADKFLDLVALGIVADVAYQTGDARYLLQRGLDLLRCQPRPGLQEIYERAELNPHGLNEEHIGFVIAPRLNALGRLGDANPAVELLITADRGRARMIALNLEALNARRQLLTSQVLHGALSQLETDRSLLNEPALVLMNPSWEAGVIGIVASRLVEMYGKPVVLIAAPPGGVSRGSARSINGVDITQAIATQAELLQSFGGHAMAAGFSLLEENIVNFRRGLCRAVASAASKAPYDNPPLQIDAFVPWESISLDTVAEIERLAPFGPGNPALTLASRDLRFVGQAALGREQEHLVLTIEDTNGFSRRVTWWGGANYGEVEGIARAPFDLAFRLRSRTYLGLEELQLELVDLRPVPGSVETVEYHPVIEDYRRETHPMPILLSLFAQSTEGEILLWVEGKATETLVDRIPRSVARQRFELVEPVNTLVIWTAPPSAAELRFILEQTHPQRVIIFGVEPEEDVLSFFSTRLAGLVRFVIARQEGRTKLSRLASAMAQREVTVLRGLEWLAAQGHFSVLVEGNNVEFSLGNQVDHHAAASLLNQLSELLNETRAYRYYFRRAQEPLREI
jgi:single-stranded-DNA-specific exonuclease